MDIFLDILLKPPQSLMGLFSQSMAVWRQCSLPPCPIWYPVRLLLEKAMEWSSPLCFCIKHPPMTHGQCSRMASIHSWNMSCLILGPKGILSKRSHHLCDLNIIKREHWSVRCICRNAYRVGPFVDCCSGHSMWYIFCRHGFMVLSDDGPVQVACIQTYPYFSIQLHGKGQWRHPWSCLYLLSDDFLCYQVV